MTAAVARSVLAVVLMGSLVMGILWNLQVRGIFKEEALHVQAHNELAVDALGKQSVDGVMEYIRYRKDSMLDTLKRQVQCRVQEGYDQSLRIYEKNRGRMTDREIQERIVENLRNQYFFSGRGRYIVGTLSGLAVLNPELPSTEGKSILDLKDARGTAVPREVIRQVRDNGAGFVTGYWPHPFGQDDTGLLKVMYVKRFEPYDWYIGTGDFLADTKEQVQNSILQRYSRYANEAGNGVHLFILNQEGAAMTPRLPQPVRGGAGVSASVTAEAIIAEDIKQLKSNPQGVYYTRSAVGADGVSMEMRRVYLQSFPEWGWIIGAEVSPTAVGGVARWTSEQIQRKSMEALLQIMIATLLICGVGAGILKMVMRRFGSDYREFMVFFRQAATENIHIDGERLRVQEFYKMAQLANLMVEKRNDAETGLSQLNEELERRIADRTMELKESVERLETTQELLLEHEKMAMMGSLAAGLTHEMNTPLGVSQTLMSDIGDQLAALQRETAEGTLRKSDMEKRLNRIALDIHLVDVNLKKAVEHVRSLKLIAVDQGSGERRWFNLREYLYEIVVSLGSRIEKCRHKVSVLCEEDLWLDGYPGYLSQIFTNLIMNSIIHGFEGRTGGQIEIEVIGGEERILFRYQDDGVGIPESNMQQVFEPFFTTRRNEGGSGLGLYIVRQLVTEKLQGSINLSSPAGHGVRFDIDIPRNLSMDPEKLENLNLAKV